MSVSPTDGIGLTQGQRKTLTRVGVEPTTFGFDHRCSKQRAKLSDYGAANFMRQCTTSIPGARIYAAPEALTSQQSPKVSE